MAKRTKLDPIDRIRNASTEEKLRSSLIDDLVDLVDVEEIRARASALEALADAVDAATEALEGWRDADDRETKSEYREESLDALGNLLEAYDEVEFGDGVDGEVRTGESIADRLDRLYPPGADIENADAPDDEIIAWCRRNDPAKYAEAIALYDGKQEDNATALAKFPDAGPEALAYYEELRELRAKREEAAS